MLVVLPSTTNNPVELLIGEAHTWLLGIGLDTGENGNGPIKHFQQNTLYRMTTCCKHFSFIHRRHAKEMLLKAWGPWCQALFCFSIWQGIRLFMLRAWIKGSSLLGYCVLIAPSASYNIPVVCQFQPLFVHEIMAVSLDKGQQNMWILIIVWSAFKGKAYMG